jgi:hypothetical protein
VSLSECFRALCQIDFDTGWLCTFVETLLVSSTDCTGCTLSEKPLGDVVSHSRALHHQKAKKVLVFL